MNEFLNVLSKISAIKKTEVILPVALKNAIVTPLTVGDDLTLKSSVLSPSSLDMDLIKLIYDHSEFIKPEIDEEPEVREEPVDDENEKPKTKKAKKEIKTPKFYQPKFDEFLSQISHIDKLMLIIRS